jgi:hypothetical protein
VIVDLAIVGVLAFIGGVMVGAAWVGGNAREDEESRERIRRAMERDARTKKRGNL